MLPSPSIVAAPAQIAPVNAPGVTYSPGSSPAVAGPRAASVKASLGALPGPMTSSRFGNFSDLGVPLAVLGIVLAMIMPIPSFLLDVLISANITMSVIVLLVSIYITKPVEFSVFPTSLLLLTLVRLALNISSSRLMLIHGNTGTRAAGQVIEAFGNFVVGGNYIIGAVIFLVLIAIQYVVINHGAVRISEVTARFTLDALPGKQMSIDSDLNAGLIDEAEARDRRKKLAAEAEFYGAMDGASRFTQRDAVASVLITTINIVAGFLIGVLQNGMDLSRALSTYTVLTIGDGLVTVIPALMVSVSGGLIVTRASSEEKLGADVRRQVFTNPQPLLLAGGGVNGVGGLSWASQYSLPDSRIGRGVRGLEAASKNRGSGSSSRGGARPGEGEPGATAARGTAGCGSGTWSCADRRRGPEFAAASPHRRHPEANGYGSGLYGARCTRHRQSSTQGIGVCRVT